MTGILGMGEGSGIIGISVREMGEGSGMREISGGLIGEDLSVFMATVSTSTGKGGVGTGAFFDLTDLGTGAGWGSSTNFSLVIIG